MKIHDPFHDTPHQTHRYMKETLCIDVRCKELCKKGFRKMTEEEIDEYLLGKEGSEG